MDAMLLHRLLADKAAAELPDMAECRRIREQSRLTQSELAQVLGVSRPAVTRWESGARTPRGRLRVDYARTLAALRLGASDVGAGRRRRG